MYHTDEIVTAACFAVVVQHKACATRTIVCSRQILAQLLTIVFSSTAFVNVWNYTVSCTTYCKVIGIAQISQQLRSLYVCQNISTGKGKLSVNTKIVDKNEWYSCICSQCFTNKCARYQYKFCYHCWCRIQVNNDRRNFQVCSHRCVDIHRCHSDIHQYLKYSHK